MKGILEAGHSELLRERLHVQLKGMRGAVDAAPSCVAGLNATCCRCIVAQQTGGRVSDKSGAGGQVEEPALP